MTWRAGSLIFLAVLISITQSVQAAPRKTHTVVLGAVRKVPYSKGRRSGRGGCRRRPNSKSAPSSSTAS